MPPPWRSPLAANPRMRRAIPSRRIALVRRRRNARQAIRQRVGRRRGGVSAPATPWSRGRIMEIRATQQRGTKTARTAAGALRETRVRAGARTTPRKVRRSRGQMRSIRRAASPIKVDDHIARTTSRTARPTTRQPRRHRATPDRRIQTPLPGRSAVQMQSGKGAGAAVDAPFASNRLPPASRRPRPPAIESPSLACQTARSMISTRACRRADRVSPRSLVTNGSPRRSARATKRPSAA